MDSASAWAIDGRSEATGSGAAGPAPADRGGRDGARSAAWSRVLRMVDAAALTDSVVLIAGETGCGKTFLAQRLHAVSRRASGPFATLSARLDLGLPRLDGGTLHVESLTDLSPADQSVLVAFLRARDGNAANDVPDVRVVVTSHPNPAEAVQKGALRVDLFYRVNVIRVDVPPLRRRPDDIVALTRHFAREIAQRMGREAPSLSAETLTRLAAHPWPGNARELRNAIERALTLDPDGGLETLLAPSLRRGRRAVTDLPELHLRAALRRLEKALLLEAYRRAHGVGREAARLLGVDQRNLPYFLKKHGLAVSTRRRAVARRSRPAASAAPPDVGSS